LPLSPKLPLTVFFTTTHPYNIYTLSLHDALPIWAHRPQSPSLAGPDQRHPAPPRRRSARHRGPDVGRQPAGRQVLADPPVGDRRDRKSTRLNSSHVAISYAVFCLKKKKNREKR